MTGQRLRRGSDFRRVIEEGTSAVSALAVVYALPVEGSGGRVGVAVGRRLGHAVVRNRLRRRWREVVRRSTVRVPQGWDVVLLARAAGRRARFGDLERVWRELLRRSGVTGGGERAWPGG